MDEILQMAISNGLWATLFVFLLFYQLKDSAQREKKYQQTIESLSENNDELLGIKKEVICVKQTSETNKKNIENIKTEMSSVKKNLSEVKKEVIKTNKLIDKGKLDEKTV